MLETIHGCPPQVLSNLLLRPHGLVNYQFYVNFKEKQQGNRQFAHEVDSTKQWNPSITHMTETSL